MRFRKMTTANSDEELIELIVYKYHMREKDAKVLLDRNRKEWTWNALNVKNGMDWKPGDPIL